MQIILKIVKKRLDIFKISCIILTILTTLINKTVKKTEESMRSVTINSIQPKQQWSLKTSAGSVDSFNSEHQNPAYDISSGCFVSDDWPGM